jgi:hypothetical protein
MFRYTAITIGPQAVAPLGWIDACLAYLLVLGSGVYDISHQNRQEFSDTIDTCGEGSIGGRAPRRLTSLSCSFYPLPGYGVYDIEYSQFVGARCLLEVCVDLLDKNGFILQDMVSLESRDLGDRMRTKQKFIPVRWRCTEW